MISVSFIEGVTPTAWAPMIGSRPGWKVGRIDWTKVQSALREYRLIQPVIPLLRAARLPMRFWHRDQAEFWPGLAKGVEVGL